MRTNSDIVDLIVHLYKEKGWSLSELSRKVDIPKSSLSRYFNKNRQFPLNKVPEFSKVLGVSSEYIYGIGSTSIREQSSVEILPFVEEPSTLQQITDTSSQLDHERQLYVLDTAEKQLQEQNTVQEESAEYSSDKVVSIKKKLFKYHVYEKLSAGTGESYSNDWNYDEVYYDEEIDHDFASWIFGDSMEPRFLNGEVALIKDTGFDYDGAIYAVEWDGQTYIKKVKREKDGLRLISLNSKYKDKFAPYDEDPRIIGKIVGSFQPLSI